VFPQTPIVLVAELHEWATGVKWRALNRYSRVLMRVGETVGSKRLIHIRVSTGKAPTLDAPSVTPHG
jgi:hypothetical protein